MLDAWAHTMASAELRAMAILKVTISTSFLLTLPRLLSAWLQTTVASPSRDGPSYLIVEVSNAVVYVWFYACWARPGLRTQCSL